MNQREEPSPCAIKRCLAEETDLAARFYSEAVGRLTDAHKKVESARAAVDHSRDRADVARIALEEHLELHGC